MPATIAPRKNKLVLSKDTVRSLAGVKGVGPVAVTTRGPTELDTYCYCEETFVNTCMCGTAAC